MSFSKALSLPAVFPDITKPPRRPPFSVMPSSVTVADVRPMSKLHLVDLVALHDHGHGRVDEGHHDVTACGRKLDDSDQNLPCDACKFTPTSGALSSMGVQSTVRACSSTASTVHILQYNSVPDMARIRIASLSVIPLPLIRLLSPAGTRRPVFYHVLVRLIYAPAHTVDLDSDVVELVDQHGPERW